MPRFEVASWTRVLFSGVPRCSVFSVPSVFSLYRGNHHLPRESFFSAKLVSCPFDFRDCRMSDLSTAFA